MDRLKKNLILILGVVLIALVIIISTDLKLTAFAIKENIKDIQIPEVEVGEEKIYLYNKYSNNSGIIVSAPTSISCSWKSDDKDDGWKECEAIFEIDDKTNAKKFLSSPEIALNFKNNEEIREIEVSYSQDFIITEEVYSSPAREIVVQKSEEKMQEEINQTNFITGMVVTSEDKEGSSVQSKREERIQKMKEKGFIISNAEKKVIKHEDTKFKKREFLDFSTAPIIEDISTKDKHSTNTEEVIPIQTENISSQNLNETISVQTESEEEFKKTKDVILKVNVSESEESEKTLSIIGNVIKMIKPKEDFRLNTNNPFAIKVTFEIPKYSSNSFNFSISDGDFKAAIDPDLSGCGTLDTENAVYSLTQNAESVGACFTVTANNITIDCQGYSIRYSSAGSPSYGIYSTASSTKVRNCTILSGDLNNKVGSGIYFSGTDNGEIYNNIITIDDKTQEAIFLENSTNVLISNNKLDISETDSYGIYLTSSDYSNIEDNEIDSSSNADTIYINSSSHIVISNNIFNTSGPASDTIFLTSSSDFTISENTIASYGYSQCGVHTDTNTDSTISENIISTFGVEAHGLCFESFDSGNVLSNNISTAGQAAYGISTISASNGNTFSQNKITTSGEEGSGLTIFSGSNSNTFIENTIIALNNISCGVLLDGSNSNIFNKNYFQTHGEEGYGFWAYDSTNTDVQNNSIDTSGTDSPALILDLGVNSNVVDNIITTSGDNSYGIEIDSFSSSNTFETNSINTSGSAASAILFLTNTAGNSFINPTAETSGASSYAVYIWGTNNSFEVLDASFNSPIDLYIAAGITEGIWNFTNIGLTRNWQSSSTGTLNAMWYLNAIANYADGEPLSNVNIIASDVTEEEKFSLSTGTNGRISRQILTEYTQTSLTETIYYSNYSIEATTSEEVLIQLINMSQNRDILFTFAIPTSSPEPISSSSAGGGSSVECISVWECAEWGSCKGSKQTRICTDENNCGIENDKLNTERKCAVGTKAWGKKNVLFDISLEVLGKSSGGMISGTIGLINLGIPGLVIANLEYRVKNSKDEIIYEEKETVPVETQVEFIKDINLSNLPDDKYTWIVTLSYEGQTEPAKAQDNFYIGKKSSLKIIWLSISILTIILIIIGAIYFINKRKKIKEIISA